jgi:outer membrane protein
MKKTALSIGLLALCASYTSQADTLLGLYAGAQGWNMETTGGFSADGSDVSFNFEEETKTSFYFALEHFIPLVPNVKLQHTGLDTYGEVNLNTNFTFGGELFAMNTDVTSDVTLTSTDIILYYEFFDNDLISFDFGINAKYLDGELFVTAKDDPSLTAREKFSGPVPMLYSRLAVGLPLTGFGAYVEGSYLSIGDHSLSDFQAAITYSLMDNLAIDATLQVGFRAITLEVDDLDNIYTDLEFKGAFAGLEVHF